MATHTPEGRLASSLLTPGALYTRDQLRQLFATRDATLNTGIFQPAGYKSVCLFVTEQKTKGSYKNRLEGDTLHWQGQMEGLKDPLIQQHKQKGIELLVFYRESEKQNPGAAFVFVGEFEYVDHEGGHPTNFILRRVRI